MIRRLLRRTADRALGRGQAAPRPAPASEPEAPPQPAPSPGWALADLAAIQDALGPTGRPRLVNHWATWCEGCVDELPLLVELHGQFGSRVDFLGLSWDGFQAGRSDAGLVQEVADFSHAMGLPWPSLVVTCAPETLFQALEMTVHTVPQIWLIDGSGAVVHRIETVLDAASTESLSTALQSLAEAPAHNERESR